MRAPGNFFNLLIAIGLVLLVHSEADAVDYSWNNSSQSAWETPGNWTPGGGPPGSSDNILTPTQFGAITISTLAPSVQNWTHDSATSHTIIGLNGASGVTLSITDTLTKAQNSTLLFRDGSNNPLTLEIGQVTATGGAILFGNFNSSTNGLTGLTIGSASFDNTDMRLNVLNGTGNVSTVTNNLALSGASTVSLAQKTGESGTLSLGSLTSADSTTTIQANSFSSSAFSTGTVILNNASGSSTYAGKLRTSANVNASDLLSVVKNGNGTQVFSGANNYNGSTTINAGKLLVNGTHVSDGVHSGAGNYLVSGGALGGSGSITMASGAAVTVAGGATLQGGVGTTSGGLSINGDLTLQDGSFLELALGSSGAHSSLLRLGGTWVFDADQSFQFTDLGMESGSYDNIITGLLGTESGLGSIGTWNVMNSGWSGTFSYDGSGGVDLSLSAVPEPSAAVLLGLGLLSLFGLRRLYRHQ